MVRFTPGSVLLLRHILVALAGLVLVLHDVLLLELTHALDFVQVDNETLVIAMLGLDALSTEDIQVVRAVEVLYPLGVLLAKLLRQAILVLVVELKACLGKDRVFLNDFVEDVDIEGQSLSTLELLDELSADGAANAVLVVQRLNALGAEGVSTVDQDAWDALAHVVLQCAELADV